MFQFKQFTIHQNRCAMKVGTDGVLLGAWTECQNAKHILDIGTGTGLIALMLAQRCEAVIDAIEIDKAAVEQAKENAAGSPWTHRITILHSSFQEFTTTTKYDLIVSNPPYFKNALKPPSAERTTARHTDNLSPEEILTGSKALLSDKGRLCLILPVDEGEAFIKKAGNDGWHCQKRTAVIPRTGAAVKRLLLCFGFKQVTCQESELIIETDNRHHYSNEYIELTKDYYLNF